MSDGQAVPLAWQVCFAVKWLDEKNASLLIVPLGSCQALNPFFGRGVR